MNTVQAICQRSSTRGYTGQPLTEREIETLVSAGLQAPTAIDRQEIFFSVLRGGNPLLREIGDEMNRLAGETPPRNFSYDAPLVIILGGESGFRWSAVDAGIAVENIALAAEDLGLGSVILGCIRDAMLGEKRAYFEHALGFPAGYAYEIAIAVGHKAVKKTPHTYDAASRVRDLG